MPNEKKQKQSRSKDEKTPNGETQKLPRKQFDKEMRKLQVELVHLQEYVKREGLRIIVVFEGRDAAGKGGVIKRITERVSPRVFRVVALPVPTDRQKTQWYYQRYIEQFPSAGEIILFDRSWYNRAGVERVMGFATQAEYELFLRTCPSLEEQFVESGIVLIKYFFDVSEDEQERRFVARATDPLRQWKLSPMDLESRRLWCDYTSAYQRMLDATDTHHAPWYRVPADDKRRARLNCIAHLVSRIQYTTMDWTPPKMGKRKERKPGTPDSMTFKHQVPQVY
jgi:polyphosphate kinase 2